MQLELLPKYKAKPILKWAGGKTQLLGAISQRLPEQLQAGTIRRYIEPFVGGGAVFFHVAQTYCVQEFILADVNPELILLHKTVQSNVDELIAALDGIEQEYLALDEDEREPYYYAVRRAFNQALPQVNPERPSPLWITRAAQIIFLNRTGYNGLFRVNSKGLFNVPFGRYKQPTICDAQNLRAAAHLFKNAQFLCCDFSLVAPYVSADSFVYFDPPYRPISKTASFNAYSRSPFGDSEQLRLAEFYAALHHKGARLMLSSSDPHNVDPQDGFFERAYAGFRIERVKASRLINSQADKRGEIDELLIMNY